MNLTRPALILNKNWTPIRIATVRDALIALFEGRAKAISVDDYGTYDFESWSKLALTKGEPFIYTATSTLRIPEIIVLNHYDKIPEPKVVFSRINIFRRDDYTCQYCSKKKATNKLTIDHVVPRSRGGKSTWTNCVVACWDCNSSKASKTLGESGLKLLRKPFKPEWTPRLVLKKVRNTPENWKKFLSEAYWNTELDEA